MLIGKLMCLFVYCRTWQLKMAAQAIVQSEIWKLPLSSGIPQTFPLDNPFSLQYMDEDSDNPILLFNLRTKIPSRYGLAELSLKAVNVAFRKNGTLKISESIFVYTAYPSSAQRQQAVEALIQKHPCLKDPVSFDWLAQQPQIQHWELQGTLECLDSLKWKSALDQAPSKEV